MKNLDTLSTEEFDSFCDELAISSEEATEQIMQLLPLIDNTTELNSIILASTLFKDLRKLYPYQIDPMTLVF